MAYKNKEDARRWYQEHRETEIERARANKRKYIKRNTEFVNEYKNNRTCADCGNSYIPEAMEFDHISSNKIDSISRMVKRPYTIEKIQEEIDKCELVCAVCHRYRTVKRRGVTGT